MRFVIFCCVILKIVSDGHQNEKIPSLDIFILGLVRVDWDEYIYTRSSIKLGQVGLGRSYLMMASFCQKEGWEK